MKAAINIDTSKLTYRHLKELVPATRQGKMPVPDKIEGKILFTYKIGGAKIAVYDSGYVTYTRNDGFGDPCTTVYSVHRCSVIVQKTGCSKSEYDEECGNNGKHSKIVYRVIKGQPVRFVITSEEAYLDEPWWMPIVAICDERIDQNLNDREKRRAEPLNDDDYHFTSYDDEEEYDPERWLEAIIDDDRSAKLHELLKKTLSSLTKVQRDTIELLFSNDAMTERKAAQILGVTHQVIHKNKNAALQALRKKFFK